MIKPWLFEFFHAVHDPVGHDDPEAVQRHFRDYTRLWIDDERLGFEGIFFSEHHFGPGYSPSPNLVIANLAGRTNTLRLGVLGSVSAYATPWRIAEEFGMLDHLTDGRLEMGVVSGIPPEYALVGIDPPRAGEVNAETLEVLLAALDKPVITHHGTHFTFDDIRITPVFRQSSPALWTAARSPESARRAGERGLKMCSGFGSVEQLRAVYDAYREGARANGNSADPDQVALRRQIVIVAEGADRDRAAEGAAASMREFVRFSQESAKIIDAPPMEVDPEELIFGTPDQVAAEIIRQCRALGAGHFLAGFNIFDLDELRTAHELFGTHVIPRLRAAEIG